MASENFDEVVKWSIGSMIVVTGTLLSFSDSFKKLHTKTISSKTSEIDDNKFFTLNLFQVKYLAVYLLAMLCDWLQGPYVYALYASYGFDRRQNGILFIFGFGSSMLFGTWVASLADRFGRKRFCLFYCLLYAYSCFTKHFNSFPVLVSGRIAGGVSTSLLFSVFESWLCCEASKRNLSSHVLQDTFSKATLGNSIIAIIAGAIAQFASDLSPMKKFPGFSIFNFGGFVTPFDFSIFFLLLTGLLIFFLWEENYGLKQDISSTNFQQQSASSIQSASRILLEDKRILSCCLICALFEASMYIFVFMWTPSLVSASSSLPYGLIFASFMTACMTGSQFLNLIPQTYRLSVLLFCSAISHSVVAMNPKSVHLIFFSFLFFEVMVGVYFPTVGMLKARLVPESFRSSIYGLFRVPMNVIVVSVLLSGISTTSSFILTSVLLIISLGLSLILINLEFDEDKKKTNHLKKVE